MIRKFHEIRRHEEGQALVLAAVCMLILALCALATVNLSFAVRHKMRLQNAADAGAYSIAAYQARAMNYYAYSNRTMVVHYASQMNMMAIISYAVFVIGVFNSLSVIPYIGWVFGFMATLVNIVLIGFQVVFSIGLIALDGINLGLWASQIGVSQAMLRRTAVESLSEVRSFNSDYQLRNLGAVSPELAWENIVDVNTFPSLNGPRNPQEHLDRSIMTEIINSARNPWTAFGLRQVQALIIPRELAVGNLLGVFRFGKFARTEYGQLTPGSQRRLFDIFGYGVNAPATAEVWSEDSFEAGINLGLFSIIFDPGSWASAQIAFGEVGFGNRSGAYIRCRPNNIICREALRGINSAIDGFIRQQGPWFLVASYFHFGQFPYARFRAVASGSQLFNQPPVALVASLPANAMQRIARPFMGDFGARMGRLSSAGSPLTQPYGGSRSSERGYRDSVNFRPDSTPPGGGLPAGLHAASAALTYYHRPGDWREPPNLFNPLWGAKLIPIEDHPTARNHPVLHQLVGSRSMVVH